MENASKALIIAGGVLIAVLLLTVFSYLFGKMASSTSSIYETLEKHEIDEFNQQFLNYEGRGITILHKKDENNRDVTYYNYLKAQDIATLINLAKNSENNSKFKTKVKITLNGVNIATQESSDWLKNNIETGAEYKCESVHINPDTLLVDEVKISPK